MSPGTLGLVFLLISVILAMCAQHSVASVTLEKGLKTKVYLSPKIKLHPGSVSSKNHYDIEFPKGHIAIKSFNAELVDEAGQPVSLKETYLHHWFIVNYYQRIGAKDLKYNGNVDLGSHQSDFITAGNAGVCTIFPQFFGMGAETRKTAAHVPDPYGIEVGNPLKVPAGYLEKWKFNIHAIDTRDAIDTMGCTECRCNLYNVMEDEYGRPLEPSYAGGLHCCYDGTQCKVKNRHKNVARNIYLKYTVKWVDWSDFIIEYNIEQSANNDYISTKRSSVRIPIAGDVIYGVVHLHSGGIGSALYGEDGRVICLSKPIYGKGNSVGDEAGYVVGMSSCYPKPESSVGMNDLVQVHEQSKVPSFVCGVAVLLLVSYNQLLKATDGFPIANLIGEGGFSSVYKGILDFDDKFVAIKVLHLQNRGAHKSFLAECEAWRNIRHRMPNGSVHDWLHSSANTSKLNLLQRINILIDVATALDYLHKT
ncbi:Stress up-regulated Nod 19 [Artemisia annua]|uniref:Stress up-regulated Nod 19 n=1 Tax=Artemisia annua TaxID=35608 RepID=A0A2U1M2S0_ARTAN|nr:Stress up-regulated Nod 19 [Artemisia annua]